MSVQITVTTWLPPGMFTLRQRHSQSRVTYVPALGCTSCLCLSLFFYVVGNLEHEIASVLDESKCLTEMPWKAGTTARGLNGDLKISSRILKYFS